MRLPAVLLLALFLVGFASRPTVSAALTNGDVLMHHLGIVQVVGTSAMLEASIADNGAASISGCVSLGIMPDTCEIAVVHREALSSAPYVVAEPTKPSYEILRPPKSIA
ncbi:hypothetical protein ABIB57_003490 [Devosia sp. UYZn731]|uniref:hypothetical protein n=1 Tax=Devosia sp. UYZn731 TaxID=3156345 RepID=UPI003394A78A